jgi:hypothetical protein
MILSRIALICAFHTVLVFSAIGQTPTATLEIQYTGHSSGFWGRYVICYGRSRIAGWTNPQSVGELKRIEGIFSGPKTRIKGILYASGCALQTLDIAIKEGRLYQYSFRCDPVPQTEIRGVTEPVDPLHLGHRLRIEAKYVALWASAFLGYDDGTTTEIPLAGESTVDDQGHFRLSVPDFRKDKLANSPNHAAELRIWARDQDDDRVLAKLRFLSGNYNIQPTRFGGIPLDSIGSSLLEFATCYADPPATRDEFGFNVRGMQENDCMR